MSLKTKMETDENYFIKKAKTAEESDPFTAKAWILTAKSLSPNNFGVQFEVYKQAKSDKNYAEAAKCFSYIMLTFQSQPPELRREISQLTTALRAPDDSAKKEEDFYVEMFQHISYEPPAFELMMKVIAELPSIAGKYVKNVTSNVVGRNMVFLPLTKRAILQYCIKVLVKQLKAKVNDSQRSNDAILSSMLVLIQLYYPAEMKTAEFIFDRIRSKQSFSFPNFSTYIICPDFLKEFMYLYTHENKIQLELSTPTTSTLTRRIGTRGSDRSIKGEFKQLIRKQMARSNEDIEALILQFITQEGGSLMQLIFD